MAWATGLESSSSNDSSVLVFGHFAGRAKVAWDSVELLKGLSEHPRWGHRLSVLLGPGEEKLVRCRHRNVNDCFNDFKETDGRTVQLLTWLRQRPVITIWSNILLVHGQLSLPMLDDIVMDAWKKRREIACEVPGSECGREVVDPWSATCLSVKYNYGALPTQALQARKADFARSRGFVTSVMTQLRSWFRSGHRQQHVQPLLRKRARVLPAYARDDQHLNQDR